MFRSMRRTKQELPFDECARILKEGSAGVLGTAGTDGYPYAVPLSYVYLNGEGDSAAGSPVHNNSAEGDSAAGRIVFHCSQRGHKVDALRENPRASFCVIAQDDVIPIEFATHYKSVIAFGTVRFVEDATEKRELLTALGAKYSPGLDVEAQEEIDRFIKATCVIVLDIERLTGKQAKGLAEQAAQA